MSTLPNFIIWTFFHNVNKNEWTIINNKIRRIVQFLKIILLDLNYHSIWFKNSLFEKKFGFNFKFNFWAPGSAIFKLIFTLPRINRHSLDVLFVTLPWTRLSSCLEFWKILVFGQYFCVAQLTSLHTLIQVFCPLFHLLRSFYSVRYIS